MSTQFAFGKQSDNSLSLCSDPTANRKTPLGQSNFLPFFLSLLSSKKPLLGVGWGHKLKTEVYELKKILLQDLGAYV